MSTEASIVKVRAFLNSNHIVRKHNVVETDDDRPTIRVKLWLINIIADTSEFTKVLRQVRSRAPATHAIKFIIRTTL